MLATEAALARGALKVALLVALTLITLHGLDRQAGQILHPPAMAAVPGPAGDGVQTGRGRCACARRRSSRPWLDSRVPAIRSSSPIRATMSSTSATRCCT